MLAGIALVGRGAAPQVSGDELLVIEVEYWRPPMAGGFLRCLALQSRLLRNQLPIELKGKTLKYLTPLIILLSLSFAIPAVAADADAGLAAIKQLGSLNGQALACADKSAAGHAKLLMLAHAPKTATYGRAYEEATNAGFLAQTRDAASCPDAKTLGRKIDAVAEQLSTALPAAAK